MDPIKTCVKCQEEITDNTCVIVDDKHFHTDHFTCHLCNSSLNTQPYHIDENGSVFYCQDCYATSIASKCAACGNPILENIVQLADDVQLHKECFICYNCKKQLTSDYTKDEEEHVICYECAENNADKCDICGLPITDYKITTANKTIHQSCFKCSYCTEIIDQETYDEEDGKFIHRRCLNLTCDYCKNVITSEYYKYKDLLYHSECVEQAKQQIQNEVAQQENVLDNFTDDVKKELENEEQRLKDEQEFQKREVEARRQEEQRRLIIEMERIKQEEQFRKQREEEQIAQEKARKEAEEKTKIEKQNEKQVEQIQNNQNEQIVVNSSKENIVNKVVPYNTLITDPPADIDFTKKEAYLSEEEFQKIFSMQRSEFNELKAWRQKELKQKFKLF